jgi:hypothetical protein
MIIRNLASKANFPSMLRLRSAQAKARGDRQAERGPALSEVEVSRHLKIKNGYLS